MDDVGDARAILLRIQVVMTDDHGAGIARMQFLKQSSHGSLLCLCARVGGLTADVEPALIADAYRVGVVILAVGTDHPFRTARLNLSVTTDDVVVADAKLIMSVAAMPGVDLSGRGGLVGPHCRTMNNK